jgi:polar amino acid transport system substrate-binding protein
MMQRLLRAVLLVALAGGALNACSSDSNPTRAGFLNVASASGHPEWPPIMYLNGSTIDGAGADLVEKIFADLGRQTAFPHAGTWDEVQAKARTGEVDVLVAAYKTTERETYMLYSDPYTTDPVALFVGTGKTFPFDTWNALIGKKGVAMVGDSYGQQFDDFAAANLQLTRATTATQAFALIATGQADYFIYSLYAGNDHLKKSGGASQFQSLPRFVAEEPFYITISKASPFADFLPQVNEAIAKYIADGTVAALIAQHTNR